MASQKTYQQNGAYYLNTLEVVKQNQNVVFWKAPLMRFTTEPVPRPVLPLCRAVLGLNSMESPQGGKRTSTPINRLCGAMSKPFSKYDVPNSVYRRFKYPSALKVVSKYLTLQHLSILLITAICFDEIRNLL